MTDSRSYDSFGDLSDYSARAGSSEVFRIQYSRDELGRVTDKTEAMNGVSKTYTYSYDAAGRLAEVKEAGVTVATYLYDSNGNRITVNAGTPVTATYDDQDRLVQYGGVTYSYTGNGELASKTSGSQTTTYQYDELGNLMAVTLPDGRQVEYVIDGQNRRIGKKVNNVLVQGWLYKDRLNPVAELDGSGAVISRFVYATRKNIPNYMIKSGVTYRIISDHLGSVRLVAETATGAIAQRMDYDAFGNVVLDTNPGFQPFGFAGGLYDLDTGFTRFGARDYDAETGRWTAKDPIQFAGGSANLYGYALDDPVNLSDPTGTIPPVIVAVAVAVASNPELVVIATGVITGIVNVATGTSQPYDPESAPYELATELAIEAAKEGYELSREIDELLERVRNMREEAEASREELERLLEELHRMFPCRNGRGR